MRVTDVSAEWLTAILKNNGQLATGQVTTLQISHHESHATAVLALHAQYSADATPKLPQKLICKLYLSEQFNFGWGDSLFYSNIQPKLKILAVPECLHVSFDVENRICILLLKDVTLTHTLTSDRFLSVDLYKKCVDELIVLHSFWWEHDYLQNQMFESRLGGPLKMVQAVSKERILEHGKAWQKDLTQLLSVCAPPLSQEEATFCELVCEKWPSLFAARVEDGQNLTLIHGDYHADGNICLPRNPNDKIRILDWETWKRSLGVYDLAYLLAYQEKSDTQIEQTLLDYYHQDLLKQGIEYSWEQCLEDYRLSLLACVYPPLFWPNAAALKTVINACQRWECAVLLH